MKRFSEASAGAILFVVAAVLVIGGLVATAVATQGFGFFLANRQNNFNNHIANVNNNAAAHRFQHSYGTESGDMLMLTSDFQGLQQDTAAYGANSTQAKADITDICTVVTNMQGGGFTVPPSDITFLHTHCVNGVAK